MNGLIDEQVESTSIMQVSIASYDSSIHSQAQSKMRLSPFICRTARQRCKQLEADGSDVEWLVVGFESTGIDSRVRQRGESCRQATMYSMLGFRSWID